jgi:Asp-tRNA(Asn)/Glu-tRNA(Gln) amidotransferase A subunit family amidase
MQLRRASADRFHVRDRYTDEPADEDALISTLLKSQGAIPFCKTNVPQTMLAFECSNPLFGRTLNPYSPNHVPGGSSGGEAALLASNGSPFGIGVSKLTSPRQSSLLATDDTLGV